MSALSQYPIVVLYDGICPTCIKDRQHYQKLAGRKDDAILWLDINQHHQVLKQFAINEQAAMTELHLIVGGKKIVKELDAYILLLSRIWWLKPLAWFIAIPFIKAPLARYYHYRVNKRLTASGRLK